MTGRVDLAGIGPDPGVRQTAQVIGRCGCRVGRYRDTGSWRRRTTRIGIIAATAAGNRQQYASSECDCSYIAVHLIPPFKYVVRAPLTRAAE